MPKGALISHRAMIARALCMSAEVAHPVGDHFVAWPPLYHMASTDVSLATLLRGGTVHVVDGFLPDRIIDIIDSPLPAERPLDIRESPEFLEIAHRVREGLRAGHSYDD